MKLVNLLLTAVLAASTSAPALARDATLPQPTIFAPQAVVNSDSTPSLSPDGTTLLFAQSGETNDTIVESHLTGGVWSTPVPAPFSGKWNDLDPIFSPDGSYVIFSSLRPLNGSAQQKPQLWRVNRTNDGWGEPTPLPASVNDGAFLVAPSIASDGTLYYLHIANHAHQLYRARLQNGTYQQGAALSFSGPTAHDYDPVSAADQSFVIFASSDRRNPPDKKRHLFVAFARGCAWGPILPLRYLGEAPSSDDAGPLLSRDGATLYFSSDRNGQSDAWTLPVAAWLKAHAPSNASPGASCA